MDLKEQAPPTRWEGLRYTYANTPSLTQTQHLIEKWLNFKVATCFCLPTCGHWTKVPESRSPALIRSCYIAVSVCSSKKRWTACCR